MDANGRKYLEALEARQEIQQRLFFGQIHAFEALARALGFVAMLADRFPRTQRAPIVHQLFAESQPPQRRRSEFASLRRPLLNAISRPNVVQEEVGVSIYCLMIERRNVAR